MSSSLKVIDFWWFSQSCSSRCLANFFPFKCAIFFLWYIFEYWRRNLGQLAYDFEAKFHNVSEKAKDTFKGKKNRLQRIVSIQRFISLVCVFCNLLFKQGEGVKCVGVCTDVSLTWISGLCEVVLVSWFCCPSRSFIDLGESLLRWRTNGSFIARVFVNNPKTKTTWR